MTKPNENLDDNGNPISASTPTPTSTNRSNRDDVQALIEKVRREEKEKLYRELEAKDEAVKRALAEKKALEDRIASESAGRSAEYETLTLEIAKLNAVIEAQAREAKEKEARLAEERRLAKLESYKNKQIAKIGAHNLIVELVSGNTEQEIDKSILIAQEKMAAIRAEAEAQIKKSLAQTPTSPITEPASGGVSNTTGPTNAGGMPIELTAEAIRKMSPEEYKRYRDLLKKEATKSITDFYRTRQFQS